MADLRAAGPDGRRRGQIILIAAFALAVTFVALAIIVNSAIFTENLASRGETAGTDDALHLRAELEGVLGEVLRQANVHNTSNLDQAVDRGVANATHALERQHAARGAYVNVTLNGTSDGHRIAQNESSPRALESTGGASGWTVVENVPENGTRAFELSLVKADLHTSASGAFEVEVENATATWQVRLWRDGTNEVVATVEADVDEDGTVESHECRRGVPEATVSADLTRGTLDGRPCAALRRVPDLGTGTSTDFGFGTGVSGDYEIDFRNGNEAVGNYSLLVDGSATPVSTNLNASGSRASPYVTDAVYSLVVDYRYERPRMTYRTEVRVAPGESP